MRHQRRNLGLAVARVYEPPMAHVELVNDLSVDALSRFDDIIDVRAPSEFADDHIPGAINLPVLDDDERARIGTTYVRGSKFRARRDGAALVTANISRHLSGVLADKPAAYRPLVYCWRGGMRSRAMATILSAIGWQVAVVGGGYKTWRRNVVTGLRTSDEPIKVLLLDGQTGTGKTETLLRLQALGAQILDLEGLANHRGSVFGAIGDKAQPSQKLFESRLWTQLARLDPGRPIVVEAESKLIGRRTLPERLARAMQEADRIEVHATLTARAKYLVTAYSDLAEDLPRLTLAIEALRPFHARTTIEHWLSLARSERLQQLAMEIAERHYDPRYTKQRDRRGRPPLAIIRLDQLGPDAIDRAARRILHIAACGSGPPSEVERRSA